MPCTAEDHTTAIYDYHPRISKDMAEWFTTKQGGFKFGEWRDLVFVQQILETPTAPVDG